MSIGVIMKGKIRLGEFIEDVKKELIEAQDTTGAPFLELEEVQLEVCFVLDASAKAGGKLFVVEIGGEAKTQQTHKVSLTLRPLPRPTIETQETELTTAAAKAKSKTLRRRPVYRRPVYR